MQMEEGLVKRYPPLSDTWEADRGAPPAAGQWTESLHMKDGLPMKLIQVVACVTLSYT